MTLISHTGRDIAIIQSVVRHHYLPTGGDSAGVHIRGPVPLEDVDEGGDVLDEDLCV